MSTTTKTQSRLQRRRRVRAKVHGTAQRPRLSVFRSNRGIQAQLIDDVAGHTLAAVNWIEPDLKDLARMDQAKRAGELLAERAKKAGVENCVFDRGGYRFHGRVGALAAGAARRRAEVLMIATVSHLASRARHDETAARATAAGPDMQERVVEINRVAKVVKGGRRFSFTALVVVGDEKSQVGVGYGKANEVPVAIQKGVERARKDLYKVPMHGSTITHEVIGVHGAARVLLQARLRRYRRDRRRRRARGARAGRHPRRALEVARQPEPDQPRQGHDGGPPDAAQPQAGRGAARADRAQVLGLDEKTVDSAGRQSTSADGGRRRGRPAAEEARAEETPAEETPA